MCVALARLFAADFAGDIVTFAQPSDLPLVAVKTYGPFHGAEGDGKRQADIAEPDDANRHL